MTNTRRRSGAASLDIPVGNVLSRSVMDAQILERLRAIARERAAGADPAHDFLHVTRVAASARAIAAAEGADAFVVEAAALLHELINLPKDHPDSARSGEL